MTAFERFFTEPTPFNVDNSFKVGSVNFDNYHGMGATGSTHNVLYRGLVVWIAPSKFRSLAARCNRDYSAEKIKQEILKGNSVASPFLRIYVDYNSVGNINYMKVVGHEGRARSDALKCILDDAVIPVQLEFNDLRAHHLDEHIFNWLRDGTIIREDDDVSVELNFDRIFWNGIVVN